jgi:DNA-directed RNA polymerase subunit M/transcription elongation factor TFIIS
MAVTRSETTMECQVCGANNVIEIELTLPDGTEVMFCSCHQCETRWWNREGERLALDAVLDLARKPRT